jgi:exonuclease SbcC
MIIERIHLTNFKSHSNTEIDFGTGITTMMGANGAGKSSIFEAVSFALFKQYHGRIDELVKTGEKKMTVEVVFVVDGQTYQVVRSRSKSSRAALNILEGDRFQPLVSGDTEVSNEIENILEMDSELFLNTVYIRQGEIADLVDKTPAEKKQMIGRLLGIDSLEKAWKNMKFIIEKYEDDTLKLEGKLESYSELEGEITTKMGEKAGLEDELKDVDSDLQETRVRCEHSKEEKDLMDKKAVEYGNIESRLVFNNKNLLKYQATVEDLDHEVELLENTEERIEEIKPLLKRIEPLKRLKDKISTLESCKKEREEVGHNLLKARTFEKTIEETREDHESKPELIEFIDIIKDNIHEKNVQTSGLEIQNKDLAKPISELEEMENSCPICKSKITPEKRDELLAQYNSELKENRKQLTSLVAQRTELAEELIKAEDHLIKVNGNSERYITAMGALESLGSVQEYEKQLKQVQATIKEKEQEISKIKQGLDFDGDIDNELSSLESLRERCQKMEGRVSNKESVLQRLQETRETIKEIERENLELEKNLNELGYDEETHEHIKAHWELENNSINELSGEKHSLTGQLHQLTTTIHELEAKKDKYLELENDLKRVKDFTKLLQFIRDVYGKDGVQQELRNLSRPLIEAKTRELFEKFNFDYSDIQLDEDYNLSIFGPSGESSLDMISGGEKIAVALALRLAITQVLSGNSLEMVMIDEPTIFLDEYRRQELVELFKKMSILPQMIIVTHDSDLEEAADRIIKLSKEDGNSLISVGGDVNG